MMKYIINNRAPSTQMDGHRHAFGMANLGPALQIDLPREWATIVLYRDVWRGGGRRVGVSTGVCVEF